MYSVSFAIVLPELLVTCNFTAYFPGVLYVTAGFSNVVPLGVPPSKVHTLESTFA
jgi:hypothetical protein